MTAKLDTTRMSEREAAQAWLDHTGKADRTAIRERVVARAAYKAAWKHLLAHIDAGNAEGVRAHAASGDERRKLMAALHPKKSAKAKSSPKAKPEVNPVEDDVSSILAAALKAIPPEQLAAFLVASLAK